MSFGRREGTMDGPAVFVRFADRPWMTAMNPANRIIELLYNRPHGWWARADLLHATGLSAAQLDTALDDLLERGHRLEVSKAMGVQLRLPTALDAAVIERALGTRRIGRSVICFEEVNSTNDVAADCAKHPGADGVVVLAESQRAGRGRQGKRWISRPGQNILMSVVLERGDAPVAASAMTVAAGLAVAEGLDQAAMAGFELRTADGAVEADGDPLCTLKWPNDVLIDGRKVAGVLVEARQGVCGPFVVVGIGVNVNECPGDSEVDVPAVSLRDIAGELVDRAVVVRQVLRRLDAWVCRLRESPDAAVTELKDRWAIRCGMIQQRCTVRSAGRRIEGRVVEIDPLAGLLLATDEGRHVHVPVEGASVVR